MSLICLYSFLSVDFEGLTCLTCEKFLVCKKFNSIFLGFINSKYPKSLGGLYDPGPGLFVTSFSFHCFGAVVPRFLIFGEW